MHLVLSNSGLEESSVAIVDSEIKNDNFFIAESVRGDSDRQHESLG
jgi:hypothetical protein